MSTRKGRLTSVHALQIKSLRKALGRRTFELEDAEKECVFARDNQQRLVTLNAKLVADNEVLKKKVESFSKVIGYLFEMVKV